MSAAAETLKTKVLNDNKAQLDKTLAELTAIPPTPDELKALEDFKNKHDVPESEFHKHKVENERLFAIAVTLGNSDIASILIKQGTNIRNPILVGDKSLSIIDYLCQANPEKLTDGIFAVCTLIEQFPGIRIIWDKYHFLLTPFIKLLHSGEDKNTKYSSWQMVTVRLLLKTFVEKPYSGWNINSTLEQYLSEIIGTLSRLKPGFHQDSLFTVLLCLIERMLEAAKLEGIPISNKLIDGESESAFTILIKRIKALCGDNEYALLALELALLNRKDEPSVHSVATLNTAIPVSSQKQFNKSRLDNEEHECHALWKAFVQKIPDSIDDKSKASLKGEDYLKFAFRISDYQIINLLIKEGVSLETLVMIKQVACLPLSALFLDLSNWQRQLNKYMPVTLEHLKCLKLLLKNNAKFTPDILPLHKLILVFTGMDVDFSMPSAEIARRMIQMLLKYKQNPNIRNDGNANYSFLQKKTGIELILDELLYNSLGKRSWDSVLKAQFLSTTLGLLINASEINYRLFSEYSSLLKLFEKKIDIIFSDYSSKVEKKCLHADVLKDLACQVVKLIEEEYNKALSVNKAKKPALPVATATATEHPNKNSETSQITSNITDIDMENLVTATYSVIIPAVPVSKEDFDDLYCSDPQDGLGRWEEDRQLVKGLRRENNKYIPKIIENFNQSIFRSATDGLTDAYNFGLTLASTHPNWRPDQVGSILLDYYMGAADIYPNASNPFLPSFMRGWESAAQNAVVLESASQSRTVSGKATDNMTITTKAEVVGSAGSSSVESPAFDYSLTPETLSIPETTREATRALLRPLLFQMNFGLRIRNDIAITNAKQTKPKNSSP